MYCESCSKPADNPLCQSCLNELFDDYDKDELYGGENEKFTQPVLAHEA
jgi:hypothetical protein